MGPAEMLLTERAIPFCLNAGLCAVVPVAPPQNHLGGGWTTLKGFGINELEPLFAISCL